MAPAITINNLTLGYDGHPAVHHLEGSFDKASLTAIVGPNGSGKSTLLKGIIGLLPPISGSIQFDATLRHDYAYLPQRNDIDRTFPASVLELISLGLWKKRGAFRPLRDSDLAEIEKALSTVGLTGFENRPIDTLSGGQLQRALFARLIIEDARIILLDEPFAAIDEKTINDLIGVIRLWHDEGRTILTVLHDLALTRRTFPQTLLIARDQIAWGETSEVLTPANLGRAMSMTEAWDEQAPWHEPDAGVHR